MDLQENITRSILVDQVYRMSSFLLRPLRSPVDDSHHFTTNFFFSFYTCIRLPLYGLYFCTFCTFTECR